MKKSRNKNFQETKNHYTHNHYTRVFLPDLLDPFFKDQLDIVLNYVRFLDLAYKWQVTHDLDTYKPTSETEASECKQSFFTNVVDLALNHQIIPKSLHGAMSSDQTESVGLIRRSLGLNRRYREVYIPIHSGFNVNVKVFNHNHEPEFRFSFTNPKPTSKRPIGSVAHFTHAGFGWNNVGPYKGAGKDPMQTPYHQMVDDTNYYPETKPIIHRVVKQKSNILFRYFLTSQYTRIAGITLKIPNTKVRPEDILKPFDNPDQYSDRDRQMALSYLVMTVRFAVCYDFGTNTLAPKWCWDSPKKVEKFWSNLISLCDDDPQIWYSELKLYTFIVGESALPKFHKKRTVEKNSWRFGNFSAPMDETIKDLYTNPEYTEPDNLSRLLAMLDPEGLKPSPDREKLKYRLEDSDTLIHNLVLELRKHYAKVAHSFRTLYFAKQFDISHHQVEYLSRDNIKEIHKKFSLPVPDLDFEREHLRYIFSPNVRIRYKTPKEAYMRRRLATIVTTYVSLGNFFPEFKGAFDELKELIGDPWNYTRESLPPLPYHWKGSHNRSPSAERFVKKYRKQFPYYDIKMSEREALGKIKPHYIDAEFTLTTREDIIEQWKSVATV